MFWMMLLLASSCASDEIPEDEGIIGSWQLVEMYSDPGDGSGSFRPVESEKTITFNKNKTFSSNGTLCHLSVDSLEKSNGFFSEIDMTISPNQCEFSADLPYEIEGDFLIIYYFCIEGCGEKYKKRT